MPDQRMQQRNQGSQNDFEGNYKDENHVSR